MQCGIIHKAAVWRKNRFKAKNLGSLKTLALTKRRKISYGLILSGAAS